MRKERTLSSNSSSVKFRASRKQLDYLNQSNYTVSSPLGLDYRRSADLLAFDPASGDVLIREKASFDGHDYVKFLILSKEGLPERYKGQRF